MPELPEVENIRLQLVKYLRGHKIKDIVVNYQKAFEGDKVKVIGGKVEDVRRFGKSLSIDLDNNYSLFIHIKMTGQLIYRGPKLKDPKLSEKIKGGAPGKHTHVVFKLDSGELYYNDVRKFGWIRVVKTSEVENTDFVKKLGKDALYELKYDEFAQIVSSTSRAIKTLLMDQKKIAGIGNIYANDALFKAGIDPQKPASKLNSQEVQRLYQAIGEVLKMGLEKGGASESSFVTPDGSEGDYQNISLVYGKEGEDCPNGCGGKIEKTKISGRGTFYCPSCQT